MSQASRAARREARQARRAEQADARRGGRLARQTNRQGFLSGIIGEDGLGGLVDSIGLGGGDSDNTTLPPGGSKNLTDGLEGESSNMLVYAAIGLAAYMLLKKK
jgi:hypothetical protein